MTKFEFLRDAKVASASCIQQAYRCRLARRFWRRKHKILTYLREIKAAVLMQCWMRQIMARRIARSKKALLLFKNKLNSKRPDFAKMTEKQLLEYAVLKVSLDVFFHTKSQLVEKIGTSVSEIISSGPDIQNAAC